MGGETIPIRSSEGGEFDCYVVLPQSETPVPAMVLASAVHGVDADIRALADEFAANGFVAAAPDLFWRSLPGPLGHDDERAQARSQPRLEKIKADTDRDNFMDGTDAIAYGLIDAILEKRLELAPAPVKA